MRIEWLNRLDDIEKVEREWRRLESSVFDRTVFSCYDWIMSWYRNYGGVRGNPMVGLSWKNNELVGIAPLVYWTGTFGAVPVRRIDFAGHNSEAGEFLVCDDEPEVIGCFLDSLVDTVKFDLISFNNFHVTSNKFRLLRDAAAARKHSMKVVENRYATVDIKNGFDAYSKAMSSNFRHNLKRYKKKIEAVGAWEIDRINSCCNETKLAEFIERVFMIADSSWKARDSGPMADYHRQFYKDVAYTFAKHGMLDLSILKLDDKDAAYIFALVERGTYYDCTISYAEDFKSLSPGIFLMIEMLKLLPDSGIHTVVSHGDHDYKLRWTTKFVTNVRVLIFPKTVRGQLSRIARFKLLPLISRFRGLEKANE